ncbi:G patch domain-containing protein 3 [Rhinoderma darwinii]|uniref:G patch domain-containing protein 3 n=1 Tax=Rhinoderma darwinii TaxID=43563 RepID=UPI003F678C19
MVESGSLPQPTWRQFPATTKMADSDSHMTVSGKMEEECAPVLFVISRIPGMFRSAHLRHYFSQFTESDGFVCFHYRHRPERRELSAERCTSFCCPVTVRLKRAESFMKMYHGKPWLDPAGNQVPGSCLIHRVRDTPDKDPQDFPYKTRRELLGARCSVTDAEQRVTSAELLRMSELNPPALMPQGNVGTPVGVFMQLIRSCRLPPKLITRLGLQFRRSRRRYSNVPYVYSGTETSEKEEGVYTANGHEISEGGNTGSNMLESDLPTEENDNEEQSHSEDDNDTCEEWERHEALHEDVTSQERSKERLYEERIELKWEKGGSGLVFYTDAQLWQQEEGDFDEQTADDWDVDMSEYYEPGTGDKDARDFLKMRLETRRRDGLDTTAEKLDLGGFEQYTKGVGRKVMERQGWTDGTGLGSSGAGIPEALENEGQHPKCKYGLGYHGEKLSTFCPKQKKPRYYISTVYDEPREEDMGDTLLRRQPSTTLKHRNNQKSSL